MYQCVTANISIWFLVCKLENHSVQIWHMQVYVCISITGHTADILWPQLSGAPGHSSAHPEWVKQIHRLSSSRNWMQCVQSAYTSELLICAVISIMIPCERKDAESVRGHHWQQGVSHFWPFCIYVGVGPFPSFPWLTYISSAIQNEFVN